MNTSERKEQQYLVIGGTTKAATTSLYYYLADHPDICPATRKETRFFIDEDYPVPPSGPVDWANTPGKFDTTYFKNATEKYRLEATPDYLYSTGTPQRLKDTLPGSKVVFLLRDPVTRMISWYKYARQRANIPETMSFDEYVEAQLNREYFEQAKQDRLASEAKEKKVESSDENMGFEDVPSSYFFCALEHGRYARYLQHYFEVLGRDNVKVYFYEDLCVDPQAILFDLCEFASIPTDFYTDYDFKVFNRSRKMKNARLNKAYSSLRAAVRKRTHNLPIHKVLRKLRLWTDPLYYRLNSSQETQKIEVSQELHKKLEKYYQDDVALLENLMGRSLPWSISSAEASEVSNQSNLAADLTTTDLETTLAKS